MNIVKDPLKERYNVKWLDTLCENLTHRKFDAEANRFPSIEVFFTGKKPEINFDWKKAYEETKKELLGYFMFPKDDVEHGRTLKAAIRNTHYTLKLIHRKKSEELWERNKETRERILKFRQERYDERKKSVKKKLPIRK